MNQKIELTNPLQKAATEAVKTTERLRARLLLVFGILVLCTIAIEYTIVKLEQPLHIGIQTTSLLLAVFSLPIYFIVLLIREHLSTWRQRKRIARMVAQLSAHLAADEAVSVKRHACGKTVKTLHSEQANTLVQKIVQVINA